METCIVAVPALCTDVKHFPNIINFSLGGTRIYVVRYWANYLLRAHINVLVQKEFLKQEVVLLVQRILLIQH